MKPTLTVGLLAVLATTALGQAKLTGIETSKVGDGLQIVIKGEGLSKPRSFVAWNGSSYIVEFDANLIGKPSRTRVDHAGVQYVQTLWFKPRPPVVRVQVKGKWGGNPTVNNVNGDWVVSIGTTADPLALTPNQVSAGAIVPIKTLQTDDQRAMTEAEKLLMTEIPVSPPPIVANEAQTVETPQAPTLVAQNTSPAKPVQVKPVVKPQPATSANYGTRRVSLDFVGTDVVQILKALSIQAGVNIVTAPDVSPTDKPVKLSIALSEVELDSALSYVTAMANLRYARVGNTYVVTPAATFSAAIRQILQRNADGYQTRVVNLVSGEAEKIREATLKALPPEGEGGYYEIIVPGTGDLTATPVPNPGEAQANLDPQAQADPKTTTQLPNNAVASTPKGRAYYLLVMGEPSRLSAVEDYVHQLDAKVAASFSLSRSSNVGTVAIPIQSGQTSKIKDMIQKLLTDNPRSGDYSITESSVKELQQGEQAINFLLMIGPEAELATLKSFAIALDRELCKPLGITYAENVSEMVKDYEIVELMYLEPIIAAQDLKGRFKDLWVTVVPDTVTPGIKGEAESKKDEAPTDNGNGQNGAPAAPTEKVESKLKKQIGLEPMRLILRGSPATIAEAKHYLSLIDVAPRQIALEMRVMDLTKEEALNFGLDWTLGLGGTGTVTSRNAPPGANNITGTIGSLGVTAVLDSLANDRRLIARPNALVSDGRQAHLFVGDTVRYVKSIQATTNGITVVTDELEVGSQFDIKARVGSDGSIALDLGQKFTMLTSWLDIPGGGKLPQTSDRVSNMFVNMKSGETIAIGGLILDSDIKNYSGIPILKDLPLIGRLFGRTMNSKVRTEIVFFLTAVEVNATNRAGAASPRVNYNRNPDPMGEYKKSGKNGR